MYAEFIIIISIRICTGSENRWDRPIPNSSLYFNQPRSFTLIAYTKEKLENHLCVVTKSRFLDDATELLARALL